MKIPWLTNRKHETLDFAILYKTRFILHFNLKDLYQAKNRTIKLLLIIARLHYDPLDLFVTM